MERVKWTNFILLMIIHVICTMHLLLLSLL